MTWFDANKCRERQKGNIILSKDAAKGITNTKMQRKKQQNEAKREEDSLALDIISLMMLSALENGIIRFVNSRPLSITASPLLFRTNC